MNHQQEFCWDGGPSGSTGIEALRREVRRAWEDLSCQMGLPLNHRVEATLYCGRVLKGKLRLDEQALFIPQKRDMELMLEIEGAVFPAREITSCIRTD